MPTPRRFNALVPSLVLSLAVPAWAEPPPCTCQNLESLQQEYQNTVYLEGYMRRLAEHLKAVEARQSGLNLSTNADKDGGRTVINASEQARIAYEAANRNPPFPISEANVTTRDDLLERGTCNWVVSNVSAGVRAEYCSVISDLILQRVMEQANQCKAMGAAAYWNQMPSARALNEAELYKKQAAVLKDELRRVMDASDLRLVGEFRTTLGDESATYTDEITYDSGDLKLASEGGDRWTMTGEGDSVSMVVLNVVSPEPEICMSQPYRQPFSVTLRTDGLTFEVEATGHPGKNTTITCSNGLAAPFYGGELGKIQASRLKVQQGDTELPVENDWLLSAIMGAAAGAGASMGTVQNTTLRLTCEGQ